MGTKLLGFSIGRGLGAPKGLKRNPQDHGNRQSKFFSSGGCVQTCQRTVSQRKTSCGRKTKHSTLKPSSLESVKARHWKLPSGRSRAESACFLTSLPFFHFVAAAVQQQPLFKLFPLLQPRTVLLRALAPFSVYAHVPS